MEIWESLPPRGAWIEILVACKGIGTSIGRSPRGERGLKYACCCCEEWFFVVSLPPRGAWIEIEHTA